MPESTPLERVESAKLFADLPSEHYHRDLVSCQRACPVGTDARGYVRAIAEGDDLRAYLIARGPNPFASICGRICGAPCEAACRRGRIPRTDADGHQVGLDRPVAIRALKRYACSLHGPEAGPPGEVIERLRTASPALCGGPEEMAALLRSAVSGRFAARDHGKVAIIGAGPAGLSAAHDLALMGVSSVVFESECEPAGMLAFGVPDYRLPRHLIRQEIAVIQALGVEIRCAVTVGKDVSFAQLRRDFAAVVVAVGAKRPRTLGLPGERGPGVYGGVDFLRAVALGEPVELGREVVVIGGGNVAYDVARTVVRQAALDAARTAARLTTGAVKLASLETLEEMPADTLEILEGDEEGIERLNGWGPREICRREDGSVASVRFVKCLRVFDEERRFAPVFDEEVTREIPCDTVVLAAGQTTDLDFLTEGGEDVEQPRPGWPSVDQDTLASSAPGIFIAGDLAHGTRLLIDAVASGKKAARSVYHHLTGQTIELHELDTHRALEGYVRERDYEKRERVPVATAPPELRLGEPGREVELGYSEEEARWEASRCLDCAVTPVFDGTRCVLCGGCVDVCPTLCLKIVGFEQLELPAADAEAIARQLGPEACDGAAILKDEDRCIRCGLCALRCPVEAIAMERLSFRTEWRLK